MSMHYESWIQIHYIGSRVTSKSTLCSKACPCCSIFRQCSEEAVGEAHSHTLLFLFFNWPIELPEAQLTGLVLMFSYLTSCFLFCRDAESQHKHLCPCYSCIVDSCRKSLFICLCFHEHTSNTSFKKKRTQQLYLKGAKFTSTFAYLGETHLNLNHYLVSASKLITTTVMVAMTILVRFYFMLWWFHTDRQLSSSTSLPLLLLNGT